MKIAILATGTSWYWHDLKRAGEERGHFMSRVGFESLVGSSSNAGNTVSGMNSSGTVDLNRCDAVIVRTMPAASLEQVVFRMDALNSLEAQGVTVINPSRAIETAVDKYLSLCRLKRADLPVPETRCCQSRSAAMEAFEQMGRDVVIKPLFGGEGRGIVRVDSVEIADRTFKAIEQINAVIYMQEYIDHGGFDLRCLVIGEDVYCMQRTNHSDWRTNASRGARCEPCQPGERAISMAKASANAAGCRIAGVDMIESKTGERFVLEVNAVPGWKSINQALSIDTAGLVIELAETLITQRASV